MVSHPRNPSDIVKNIKTVFDDNLLLEDSFYSEPSLKDSFDAGDVHLTHESNGDGRHISVTAELSESIFPKIKTSSFFGGSLPGASFVADKTSHQSGSIDASLNFVINADGPKFGEVDKIFGSNLIRIADQPSPHASLNSTTAPHGNETWQYRTKSDHVEKAITLRFGHSAELSNVLIEIENH